MWRHFAPSYFLAAVDMGRRIARYARWRVIDRNTVDGRPMAYQYTFVGFEQGIADDT